MTAFPRVADRISGKFGTVIEADADGITVQWSGTGHCVGYTAAEVESGRFTFAMEAPR